MKTNNKLREALVKICNEIRSYCDDYGVGESHKSLVDRTVNDPPDYTCYRDTILKIDSIVEAALAEPVRNCEVGTAGEQYSRMLRECYEWVCMDCKQNKDLRKCALSWAQKPYKKGSAK